MPGEHRNDDELVAQLYGVGPEDGHLDQCELCRGRSEAMRNSWDSLHAADIEVPEAFLLRQRRSIRERLEGRKRLSPKVLVPVLVTLLLAVVLLVDRPAPRVVPVTKTVSDAELFNDVFQMVSDTEPSAIEPIRSLFEEEK